MENITFEKNIAAIKRMVANGYVIGLNRTIEEFARQYSDLNWEEIEQGFYKNVLKKA